MPFALEIAVIALLAYLLGSIPFGFLIARAQGIDIREHGSRNIGATNVWRVLGKKWGLRTFLLDVAKGLAAVVLAKWIAGQWAVSTPLPHGHARADFLDPAVAGITAAMGCILGHSFPVWLGFKGGKGVATSLGVIVGMMPLAALLTFGLWAVVFKVSRYVSLASIVGALALPPIVLALLLVPEPWGMSGWAHFYFAMVAGLLVIVRHRGNIQRLMQGTENRFGAPKPQETPAADDPGTQP
jgi:acyl phosphate:glycerol-3-phosphate acyltransferase